MLDQGHPVVALVKAVLYISAAVGEFADIPAFKAGTGGQYDIGELGFAFEPDRLVRNEFEFIGSVHIGVTVGLAHGAYVGASVFVIHLDGRMAGSRIIVPEELTLDRLGIGRIPIGMTVEDRLRYPKPGHPLIDRVYGRELRHARIEV